MTVQRIVLTDGTADGTRAVLEDIPDGTGFGQIRARALALAAQNPGAILAVEQRDWAGLWRRYWWNHVPAADLAAVAAAEARALLDAQQRLRKRQQGRARKPTPAAPRGRGRKAVKGERVFWGD